MRNDHAVFALFETAESGRLGDVSFAAGGAIQREMVSGAIAGNTWGSRAAREDHPKSEVPSWAVDSIWCARSRTLPPVESLERAADRRRS
jgi:hypothetical protein